MAQIVIFSGKILEKSKLCRSKKGSIYIKIILQEVSNNNNNKIPIILYKEEALKADSEFNTEEYVIIECVIVAHNNIQKNKNWYNLTIYGTKILNFNNNKIDIDNLSNQEKVVCIRKRIQNILQSTQNNKKGTTNTILNNADMNEIKKQKKHPNKT
ncbi:hypothetical protein JF73_17140 (plasmid) [Lactobacillus helsingborgensis]|uniref:Uncharacterized protein n=1 Tax=Lactobacillus helsingborgensis TaxID=1218494 RepID=A0AA47B5M3_9LACO|nr:hypothetical protein [Lactobacillus helsingborgensis]KJY60542.1 hypothetical protein JF73_17140 [Lactobacillus helsingborgensis]UZX30586.1 hypothetical protein LDX53_09420 [Lactobacillus helsingborgensis]UZX32489.1 hypothetical protein LDX52_09380 [Lactobacillus helsingborgensis]